MEMKNATKIPTKHNSRAWCKTIVTSYIKWGSYNSFAPSPRIVTHMFLGCRALVLRGVDIHDSTPNPSTLYKRGEVVGIGIYLAQPWNILPKYLQ